MIIDISHEDYRIRWSYDNGETWRQADIDELIEAYEEQKDE